MCALEVCPGYMGTSDPRRGKPAEKPVQRRLCPGRPLVLTKSRSRRLLQIRGSDFIKVCDSVSPLQEVVQRLSI